jgi:hypothetical protein
MGGGSHMHGATQKLHYTLGGPTVVPHKTLNKRTHGTPQANRCHMYLLCDGSWVVVPTYKVSPINHITY